MECSQHGSFCDRIGGNPDLPDVLDISRSMNRNIIYTIPRHWRQNIFNVQMKNSYNNAIMIQTLEEQPEFIKIQMEEAKTHLKVL